MQINPDHPSCCPPAFSQETQLCNYFAQYFPAMQDRLIPSCSLKDYLGCFSSTIAPEDGNLYYVTQYLWLKLINHNPEGKYSKETLEKVILPALFSRNVVLRRPETKDCQRIDEKLSMIFTGSYESCIKNNGVFNSYFSMVLETQHAVQNKNKTYGAIYYNCEGETGNIFSLVVHEKKQYSKYGSLLLNAALIDAKQLGMKTIKLVASMEGAPLYTSHGFIPEVIFFDERKLAWWNTLSTPLKIKVACTIPSGIMFLDLLNSYSEQNLHRALSFSGDSFHSKWEELELPKEFHIFNLFEESFSFMTGNDCADSTIIVDEEMELLFGDADIGEGAPSSLN